MNAVSIAAIPANRKIEEERKKGVDIKSLFKQIFLASTLFSFALPTFSSETKRYTTTWDGGDFSYPEGKPVITELTFSLKSNTSTPLHCHPVPTIAYMLEGEVEVTTSEGKKTHFKKGDSIIEVMNTAHIGHALEKDVEIIVFYTGAEGIPVTVVEGDPDFEKYCK